MVRLTARCITVRICLALLILSVCATEAWGQFTGLAPTSSPGLNVRHPITTDPKLLYPTDRELHLMPGDGITVTVYGVTPAYSITARILLDGTVALPLAGTVAVGGLTLEEASQLISQRFQERGIFNDAQVNIAIGEAPAHIVTFIGEVRGTSPVLGYKRLYDALSAAGGLPGTASTVLSIKRVGIPDPIVVDVGNNPATSDVANIPIFAGDTITVGSLGNYYVTGAVGAQGAHPLSATVPVTALKAMSISGGTTFAAVRDSSKIIRTVGDHRSVIDLPLKQIIKGRAPDPVLQADDIIVVPTNQLKALIRAGGVTTILGIVLTAFALAHQ
jgi:polysaccharide biosynthesis/export protein